MVRTRVTGPRSISRRRPSEESDFLQKFLYARFFTELYNFSSQKEDSGDEKISPQRCALTKGVLFPAGGIFTFIFQASCIFVLDNRRLRRALGPLVESAALHSYILTINSRFIVSRLKHTALAHSQVQLPILLSFHERVLAARGSKISHWLPLKRLAGVKKTTLTGRWRNTHCDKLHRALTTERLIKLLRTRHFAGSKSNFIGTLNR